MIRDAAIMLFSSFHIDGDMSNLGLSDLLQRFDVIQPHAQTSPSQVSELLSSPKPKELGSGDSTSINIPRGNEKDLKIHSEAPSSCHQLHPSAPQVVGFQNDEVTLVVDRLTRGSKQLRVIPVIGMAGLGKTTFALKLFNHPSIMYHFHARAWCTVSQVLDRRRVYLTLLNQTKPGCNTPSMTEDDLGDELRKSLKGKTYLIFLDDVWTPDVWNCLTEAFPNDAFSSRVILTSWHHGVVPCDMIADEEPYLLRLRDAEECLEILQAKLFPGNGCWPLELYELRMEFAENCKGLPLTAVVIAGLLATAEQNDWKKILGSISLGGLSSEEQCNKAVELSFANLPDDLKLCYLYFGAFQEDEEVSMKRLIRLWMAEGFVRKIESKRIEDVAQECMNKLVKRSLVTVAKVGSLGGVKTCRIHDILHEFCKMKAKRWNFFHLLRQSLDQLSDFNEPCNLQRLSIHSDVVHFLNSRLFCPSARSLLFLSFKQYMGEDHSIFHISYIIQIYKLLKVLDIGESSLVIEIPGEIELPTQLTYLSFNGWNVVFPSSIGNLSNLDTLIADIWSDECISFLYSLWNLQRLKYLHIEYTKGFTLPNADLENAPTLLELETLSGVVFYSNWSLERQMRKFPNIRKLSCCILPFEECLEDSNKIVVPEFLRQLESLSITRKLKGYKFFGSTANKNLQCEFGSTKNLRKVKLRSVELSREDIAVIGEFPNLEVLKLEEISYEGDMLEMEEGKFSKLRYLKWHEHDYMYTIRLRRWIAAEEQLLNLKKLVLISCTELEELPTCLDTIPALEEIELSGCSSTVEGLVRGIEEVQKDYGNSIKVHIRERRMFTD